MPKTPSKYRALLFISGSRRCLDKHGQTSRRDSRSRSNRAKMTLLLLVKYEIFLFFFFGNFNLRRRIALNIQRKSKEGRFEKGKKKRLVFFQCLNNIRSKFRICFNPFILIKRRRTILSKEIFFSSIILLPLKRTMSKRREFLYKGIRIESSKFEN